MGYRPLWESLIFSMSALGGIGYVILLTTYTKPNRILSYIGMNSIIIFGLHGHVLFFIIPKIKTFFNLSTLYTLIPLARLNWLDSIIIVLNKSIISLLLTSAQIVFLCLLIPIFNNRLYFLLGRKKPKMTNPSEVPNVVTPTPPGMGINSAEVRTPSRRRPGTRR